MAALNFQIDGKDTESKARAGSITTDHGTVETPIFMPVGTAGTVKAVPPVSYTHLTLPTIE